MSGMVIDGEASETDDEEVPMERKGPETKLTEKPETGGPMRNWWQRVGADVIRHTRRRSMTAERGVSQMVQQTAGCFAAMQNVAAKFSVIQQRINQLEDSISDLNEAARVIPAKILVKNLNIPELK